MRQRQLREQDVLARTGKQMNGRKPDPFSPDPDVRVNVVDPESRVMKTKRGYLQGFNAQAVATEDQVIIAAEVSNDGGDIRQFQPMVRAADDSLSEAGVTESVGVVVADAGYLRTAT